MKKIIALLSFLVLLTAFTCENEPLDDEISTDPPVGLTCEEATLNTASAALSFASATDATYNALCIAYKAALTAQIAACGDSNGTLQSAIDSLGDCSSDNQPSDCEQAEQAVDLAEDAFDNATVDNYTQLCNALKAALQAEIDACGDQDGSIQAEIDALGDCTQTAPSVEISLTAGTLPIEFDLVDVVVEGNILKITGETSAANSYMIYFEVEEGATGMEIINTDFVLTLSTTDPDYFPSTQGFDDFTSTITENNVGTLVGTFGGIVTNSSGGDLSLSQGVIDIQY